MIELIQTVVAGLSQGAMYSLLAVGFVIVYKATGVLNFTTGGLLLMGAYGAQYVTNAWGLPFAVAIVAGPVFAGAVAVIVERLVLSRASGKPHFTLIMMTWATLLVLEQLPPIVSGYDVLPMGDPWGIGMVSIGQVSVFRIDLWAIATATAIVLALYLFFRFTRMGVAIRATAIDPEAAAAQGIRPALVFAMVWFLGGLVTGIAGVFLGGGSRVVGPDLSIVALAAIPAVIVGGLDSPLGAVAGGLLIGVAETLTANYVPEYAPWLGKNFHLVMPYLLLLTILLLRPQGLFGSAMAKRA